MLPEIVTHLARTTIDRLARRVRGASPTTSVIARADGELPPLVLTPTVPWDIPLFQRPQQLALAAADAGWPVIYTMPGETPRTIRPNLHVSDDLDGTLARLPRCVLLVFSTTSAAVTVERIEAVRERAIVVYDFIDEQHNDIYVVDDAMRRRHAALVRSADLVLVTADRLEEQVRAARDPGRPILRSPNAVDLKHFDAAVPRQRPDDMRRFARRPVIGYYGALATWFDYALVDRIAAERPAYDIVLLGVDYDRTLSRSGILRRPNVYFLGPRPYERLPDYLACFDVATIPFVVNDITESTSPIKLFEYMAGGRAIVTTDMRECRKYRSVAIGRTPEEFIGAIDRALRRKPDVAMLAAEAYENSWARRVDDLARAVTRLAAARGARA
jgi:hypothetical protein